MVKQYEQGCEVATGKYLFTLLFEVEERRASGNAARPSDLVTVSTNSFNQVSKPFSNFHAGKHKFGGLLTSPTMSEPPSSPPLGVPGSPRTIPADSPGSWASPEVDSNQNNENMALPRQRSTSPLSSNSDTVTNTLIGDPFSESDTPHALTSPPPTGNDLDGPYKLFLTRRQLGKNIRRLNRMPAAYKNGEFNTYCVTCGWGPIQTNVANTHPQTPAMLQMVEDVKADMRATDPGSLTQAKLDGFKLRR
ncbi:hypothetical protein DL95DRAFT_412912 [Leptodontidium sp. 2 PMI_412]|nr:hypothetical protein DL95DRAFT_412912 [Leptodontidium sp. 2 PMI_412]